MGVKFHSYHIRSRLGAAAVQKERFGRPIIQLSSKWPNCRVYYMLVKQFAYGSLKIIQKPPERHYLPSPAHPIFLFMKVLKRLSSGKLYTKKYIQTISGLVNRDYSFVRFIDSNSSESLEETQKTSMTAKNRGGLMPNFIFEITLIYLCDNKYIQYIIILCKNYFLLLKLSYDHSFHEITN